MGDFLEQFDKVPASQKVLLLLLLAAGIFVAFYLLLYSPAEDQIREQQERVDSLTQQRAELQTSQGALEQVRADITELCQRQGSFMEKLPPRAEVPGLLQAIQQQARVSQLSIERFTREDDVPMPNYTQIPVSMEVVGTYDKIADFFYYVGRLERIVNVSDITISMPRGGSGWSSYGDRNLVHASAAMRGGRAPVGPPTLNVTFQISTYFADATASGGAEICAQFEQPQTGGEP
jgi:type IV pilus assembly protein PilO